MWCQITLKQILSLNSLGIFFFFYFLWEFSYYWLSLFYEFKQQYKLYRLDFNDRGVLLCSSLVAANECHPAWCTPSLLTQRGKCVVFRHIQPVGNHKMQRKCSFSTTFSIIQKETRNHLYSWSNPPNLQDVQAKLEVSQEGCFCS